MEWFTAKQIQTKRDRGLVRPEGTPKPVKKWVPMSARRTPEEQEAFRLAYLENCRLKQIAVMTRTKPSEESRLKMQLASQKYWAEQKALGKPLSNAARANPKT